LEGVVEEHQGAHGWLGLEVAPNESASLEELEIRPGVRVTRVDPGSPAEQAGILPGDILLQFHGTPVNDPDRLESLLLGIRKETKVALQVQRGTGVLEIDVLAKVRETGGQRPLYHIERLLVRAAFRNGTGPGAYPVVVRILKDSPLRAAGVREGDEIVAFQGQDPGSAGELVRRMGLELTPGEEAGFRIRRPGMPDRDIRFRAWDPGRITTGSSFWPFWSWSWDPATNREELVLGDLFLLSLYRRVRTGNEVRTCVLSLISWESGEPLLEGGVSPPGVEGREENP
ncbi:MAG: PDZ domain-containing protein, partial [Planctomycetota bacterium]